MSQDPGNFRFLDSHDARLARIGEQAERYVHTDPESCLFKLRLMVETMASTLARLSIPQPSQVDLGAMLSRLERDGILPRQYADTMHAIRRDGNAAVHGDAAPRTTAMRRLRDAFGIARWFVTQLRRGAPAPKVDFRMPPAPAQGPGGASAAGSRGTAAEAEALEDTIESQRRRTRDALMLFADAKEYEAMRARYLGELEELDRLAVAAGEPSVDAESVALVMAMELENLLEHPDFGRDSREAQRLAEAQLAAVKSSLEARERQYREQRAKIAELGG